MVEIAVLIAEKWGISPFDVLEKDVDDFITITNYLIAAGKENGGQQTAKKKETRIKVNDKTASGGWF